MLVPVIAQRSLLGLSSHLVPAVFFPPDPLLCTPAGISQERAMGSALPFAVLGPDPPDLKTPDFERSDSLLSSCLVSPFMSVVH